MKAEAFILDKNSTTLEIVEKIAFVKKSFKGKCFTNNISNFDLKHWNEICVIVTDTFLSDGDAKIVFHALDLIRQFENNKEIIIDIKKRSYLENLISEIKIAIEDKKISKLPKLNSHVEDLISNIKIVA